LWSFQNYRYIAPAFPLLMIPVGFALAPLRPERFAELVVMVIGVAVLIAGIQFVPRVALTLVAWMFAAGAFAMLLPLRWVRVGAVTVVLGLFGAAAIPGLQGDARLFAQGAVDTNTQVVAIGEYLDRKLPDASVMFHDAGAIAYYGDGRVYDMLGLVTNHQAGIANHGAGSRFEFLESLPAEQRPTHFAYYPSWLGNVDFYGDVLLQTPLRVRVKGIVKSPLVGDADMQLIVASFDHVGTGERPLGDHAGWRVVDRLDVAHLASERAHDWRGALGRRKTGDPTARWSVMGREVGEHGLVLDGGRTIRAGGERFSIAVDPARPARLVLRTGGLPSYPYHEGITKPVMLRVLDDEGRELARTELAAPNGSFVEIAFDLPAGVTRVRTEAPAPYRVFHWFVLQPR
jgi:hypothetical protein